MAFQTVNTNPNTDTFEDQAEVINNNANESVNGVAINGNLLELSKFGGGTYSAIIPNFPKQVNSGLVITTGLNIANYTAGQYQINNRMYNVGGGSFPIVSAGAGLSRIDAIVGVDNLTPPMGTIQFISGTDSVNPVSPALLSTHVLIGLILVDDSGNVNPQPEVDCCIEDGTTNNQTLRWDAGLSQWKANSILTVSSTQVIAYPTNKVETHVYNGGTREVLVQLLETVPHHSVLVTDNAETATLLSGNIGGGNFGHLISTTGIIQLQPAQGIRIMDTGTPVSTVNKLYQVGSVLYWNGNAICTAPCGGYTGTVQGSVLQYDTTAVDYIENVYTRNIAGTHASVMYEGTLTAPTAGNERNAYIALQDRGRQFFIDSNRSVMIAGHTDGVRDISILHTPETIGVPQKGGNFMIGFYGGGIDLGNQIGGVGIIAGNNCFVDKNVYDDGDGFSLVIASKDTNLEYNIEYNTAISCDGSNVFHAYNCSVIACAGGGIINTSDTALTSFSGMLFSQASLIRSVTGAFTNKPTANSCAIATTDMVLRGVDNCIVSASTSGDIDSRPAGFVGLTSGTIQESTLSATGQCVIRTTNDSGTAINVGMYASAECGIICDTYQALRVAFIGCYQTVATVNFANVNDCVVLATESSPNLRSNTAHMQNVEHNGSHAELGYRTDNSSPINITTNDYIVYINNSTATVNLPATPLDGQVVILKDVTGAGLVAEVIDGNGNTIDGLATRTIAIAYRSVTLHFEGGEWKIIATGDAF